jgi:hypothetical protein
MTRRWCAITLPVEDLPPAVCIGRRNPPPPAAGDPGPEAQVRRDPVAGGRPVVAVTVTVPEVGSWPEPLVSGDPLPSGPLLPPQLPWWRVMPPSWVAMEPAVAEVRCWTQPLVGGASIVARLHLLRALRRPQSLQRVPLAAPLAPGLALPLPPLAPVGSGRDPLFRGLLERLVNSAGVRLGARPCLQDIPCRRALADSIAVGTCGGRRWLGVEVVV